jgi:hypothetical protein
MAPPIPTFDVNSLPGGGLFDYQGGFGNSLALSGGGGGGGGGGGSDFFDIPFLGSIGSKVGNAAQSILSHHPILGGLFGDDDKKPKKPYWQRLANREYAQGYAVLNAYNRLYEPTLALAQRSAADYGDLYRRASNEQLAHEVTAATTKRHADLSDYARLAPEFIAAQRASNPILGQLYDQATSELSAGRTLTPGMRRELEEYVRAGQATRGMGLGPADVYQEALEKSSFGENLYQNRLQQATQASGLFGDVFQATTGRPAMAPAPAGANVMAPRVGTEWDDLFSYGVNREIQSRNLSAANSAANKAMIGQIVSGLLSGASGAAGAFCWVAREVFGAHSPKWKQFRQWLLKRATPELLTLYAKNGPKLAEKLKAQPALKPAIRAWMEDRIAEMAPAAT